jgi:hypothetical protein
MFVPNRTEKATGRGAWRRGRRGGEEEEKEEKSRWADGSGDRGNFEYQWCMGCGSFGQAAVVGQWN